MIIDGVVIFISWRAAMPPGQQGSQCPRAVNFLKRSKRSKHFKHDNRWRCNIQIIKCIQATSQGSEAARLARPPGQRGRQGSEAARAARSPGQQGSNLKFTSFDKSVK